jgi:hypothetical protein
VRYLEAFPQGGFFKGRNFVFDERVAHSAYEPRTVVGRCISCGAPHDDYSQRHRCARCRVLVLLCPSCSPPVPDRPSFVDGATKANPTTEQLDQPCTKKERIPSMPQPHNSTAVPSLQHGIPHKQEALVCTDASGVDVVRGRSSGAVTDVRTSACPHGNLTKQLKDPINEALHRSVLCELCIKRLQTAENGDKRSRDSSQFPSGPSRSLSTSIGSEPIRILALHGFRENAARFRGRLRALLKRWRPHVSVQFINAPHALGPANAFHGTHNTVWPGQVQSGECSSQLGSVPDSVRCSGISSRGSEVWPSREGHGNAVAPLGHATAGNTKFAWFVDGAGSASPSGKASTSLGERSLGGSNGSADTVLAVQAFGWQRSLSAVQSAIKAHGPFDGILAFSQGCVMATFVLALQQIRVKMMQTCSDPVIISSKPGSKPGRAICQPNQESVLYIKKAEEPNCQGPTHESNDHTILLTTAQKFRNEQADCSRAQPHCLQTIQQYEGLAEAAALSSWSFSFAMLCSGHMGASPEVEAALQAAGPLCIRSLHVFGAAKKDRQVDEAQSRALAMWYCNSTIVEHDSGHVVPSSRMHANKYLDFFQAAMTDASTAGRDCLAACLQAETSSGVAKSH